MSVDKHVHQDDYRCCLWSVDRSHANVTKGRGPRLRFDKNEIMIRTPMPHVEGAVAPAFGALSEAHDGLQGCLVEKPLTPVEVGAQEQAAVESSLAIEQYSAWALSEYPMVPNINRSGRFKGERQPLAANIPPKEGSGKCLDYDPSREAKEETAALLGGTIMNEDNLKPIVDLREDGYYVGAWFLAGPERDWLGVLHRDDDGALRLDFRYRYYGDPTSRDPFDGKDDKRVYTASYAGKTEEEAITITDGLVDELIRNGWCGTRLSWRVRKLRHRLIVRGDGRAFMRAMASAPFAHFKRVEPQRSKKEGN